MSTPSATAEAKTSTGQGSSRSSAPIGSDSAATTRAGTKPFATSSRMTGLPYRGPNVRQTFVAPMFPLPTVRMSTPFVQRTTQYPNGRLPAR